MRQLYPVDMPVARIPYAVRTARRLPGLIGAWLIATGRRVIVASSIAVAVLVQACRPVTWRRTVRAELVRNCVQVALYGLPSIVITGLLVGLAMVNQVLYWLRLAGQEGLIGQFLVLGLVRGIAPVLVGMIVIGRSGSTMMVELGAMRASGQVHLLDAQGIDPFLYLVIPRVLATAISMFCLSIVFLVVALTTGLVAANALGLTSLTLLDFFEAVLTAMGPREHVLLLLKTLVSGFAIGLISCTTGLAIGRAVPEVSALLPGGFVRAVVAVLLIAGAFTILL
jgi:phospholipid/cholesterol/gamma-HCH transport system permease protein